MSQAARRSNKSHRTFPRRLSRSRGRTISLAPAATLEALWRRQRRGRSGAAGAPRRFSVRRTVMSGAPRAEYHGRLQRWLEDDAPRNLPRPRMPWASNEAIFPILWSLPDFIRPLYALDL
jgi:hypothetical protein